MKTKKVAKKAGGKTSQKKTKALSAEQELFCSLYTGHHNRDLFGNATRSYLEAFGYNKRIEDIEKQIEDLESAKPSGYTIQVKSFEKQAKRVEKSARSLGSLLLTKMGIRGRIDTLMDAMISDEFNDREMQYVITQRYDLASKVAAMREYNALKKRIAKDSPTVGPITIQIAPEMAGKFGLTT